MNVSNVGRNINPVETNVVRQAANKAKNSDEKKTVQNNPMDIFSNTVFSLADSLTNIEQPANNHPLGRADYQPIDSFDEAKSLLFYFNTPEFKNTALAAHSGLSNQSAAYLFTE